MSQKISDQNWPAETKPEVSVCCTTYNHEKYIADCLDGVLMQETNFPVEIIIHDDASTDSTPSIIKEYQRRFPAVVRLISQTVNQRSLGHKILQLVFPETRGDFLAICEGDDYWSDAQKLQIQYQHLRESPDVHACFHDCISIQKRDDSWLTKGQITWVSDEVRIDDLLDGNPAMTCSAFLRSSAFPEMPEIFREFKMGDLPLWILLSLKGRILWIHRNMGVYRLHSSGSWSNKPQSEMHLGILECIERMRDLLPVELQKSHQHSVARHLARYSVHLDREAKDRREPMAVNYRAVSGDLGEEESSALFCDEYLKRATWLFEKHDESILVQLENHLRMKGCPPSQVSKIASQYFGKYFPKLVTEKNNLQARFPRAFNFLKLRR